MQTRSTVGPIDPTGYLLAAVIAGALFLCALGVETQRIAALNDYQAAQLGAPVFGRLYAPWKSLEWMERYDMRLNIAGLYRGSIVAFNPREQAWAREAFASERTRLPYELGAALTVFLVLGGAWMRRSPTSGIHGAADWANAAEIRRSGLSKSKEGIVLGQLPGTGKLLVHNGSQAVLGIGPPGSGKSDGIAKPTLIRTWKQSAIVFDSSADLLSATERARRRFSKIVVFDPRTPGSARFNPLHGIAATNIDGIKTVLSAFMFDKDPSEINDSSRFFMTSALELGIALVARVLELGQHSFGDVVRHYYAGGWKNDGAFCAGLMKSGIAYVQETGSKFDRMDVELRSSIIGTLTQHLSLFRTDDVATATEDSDFSAEMLRASTTTVYLVVREKDQRALSPLLRMVMTRLLDDLTERIPAKNEQSVLLMLDEFPLLRAPIIQQKLATVRKYRLFPVLLAQTYAQIRDYYGRDESVTGLCDVRVFFPSADLSTQELASKTCGQTTRWGQNTNHDPKKGPTRSVHETARPLLLPDELAGLPGIVVWKRGQAAILAQPVRSHRDQRFLQT